MTFPKFSHAQSTANEFAGSGSFVNILLSLCLVIGVIFSLAWVARRFNVAQAGNGQMRVVASLVAGTKEKVMVIEVGDEQHLLGVTSNTINHLAKLEKPLNTSADVNPPIEKTTNSFQNKLVEAMAQHVRGKNPKGTA